MKAALRSLPSVDQVLRRLKLPEDAPRSLAADEIRAVLAERREALLAGGAQLETPIEEAVQARLAELLKPSLRPVINATGVILHTNLGRAPLSHFTPIAGYSNLEYDLASGKRGKRDVHTDDLLRRLLARPAIVVNNNAAAVYLVLHELAAGHEVIVSRGELIEIGDGFRIPEIMSRSGAILREVGTTNRTRLDDYRQAITDKTRLILRVHPSNFCVTGFAARPELHEIARLGRERGIPVYEDLGSGCMVDLRGQGLDEPVVSESFASGGNLVSFSCDKLLGGPQSGIIAGEGELVTRIRRNPMYRAFRADKLIIESLEITLRHLLTQSWKAIPTLRMIFASAVEIRDRAERVARQLDAFQLSVCKSESPIGGGSTPDQQLPTWIVELDVPNPSAFARRLRSAPIPVIARIERDRVVLDMRTVANEEEAGLVEAILSAR
ncbi:MAG: L-seryl-tRNA(Sec) selenium transferase [Acidobacteriaceae bacterium]|nr:L-seryl-tRNA(Sec) selenium transferase [Acidobacteriaceae bacterium]